MTHIVLASQNPVKRRATLTGFQQMFPDETFCISTVSVASSVSPQPCSSAETLRGACERARQALRVVSEAHYGVGIEGGIEDHGGEMTAFAWIVVLASDQRLGKACTGTFILPEAVAALVRQGKELGEADDLVFGRVNSKQEQGAVGLLTGNVIDRTQLYTQAVVLALIPFKQQALYSVRPEVQRGHGV
ncbi:MAG TPA: inosine/xanthosine triphosphatase [Candidatus Tectomicrobia bacterium]|jgi:inosine/xanthosine triphosphatase